MWSATGSSRSRGRGGESSDAGVHCTGKEDKNTIVWRLLCPERRHSALDRASFRMSAALLPFLFFPPAALFLIERPRMFFFLRSDAGSFR